MTHDCYKGNGFFTRIGRNWQLESYSIPLDKEIIGVKTLLRKICDKYLKREADNVSWENSYYEFNKRKKLLDEIRCLSNSSKLYLEKSLSLVIYLLKAHEELYFHGLRSCQRYLVEIVSSRKISAIDKEIINDNNFKAILDILKELIGDYLEEYESLTYFFQQLDNHTSHKNQGNYSHPKFKCIQDIMTGHFQALPNTKAIIFCQSSFYMLEICNLLLQMQPLVRPVLYIGKGTKNGSNKECFSQEAITIIENMFKCKQFNVLVRACRDICNVGLEDVHLMIHLDIEQHLPQDVLWNLTSKKLDFCTVDVYLKKKGIYKSLSEKSVLSTLKVCSGLQSIDRKRKICELNKSETDKSPLNLGKKLKNFEMGSREIAFDSAFDLLELDEKLLTNLDGNHLVTVSNKVSQLVCGSAADKNKIKQIEPNGLDGTAQSKTDEVPCGTFSSCLSPVLGFMPAKRRMLSSSTPLNKEMSLKSSHSQGKQWSRTLGQENLKNDYGFIDFDLFEDWDNCGVLDKKAGENKSLITFSQAVDMVENTVKAINKEINFRGDANNLDDSIDLITGEVVKPVQESIENLFADSFDLSKIDLSEQNRNLCLSSAKKDLKICHLKPVKNNDNESIILDFGDNFKDSYEKQGKPEKKRKPAAAQKLNFENEQINYCALKKKSFSRSNHLNLKSNELDSDSSFDDILQTSFLDRLKTVESKKNLQTTMVPDRNTLDKSKALVPNNKLNSSEDFTDDSLNGCRKKGKIYNIEESDSEIESNARDNFVHVPFLNKSNVKIISKAREFLDLDVEVTDEDDCSSDNDGDESDEYEESFVDDASTFSQNIEITAKYLESVKDTNNRPGTFKIPKQKPYIIEDVFSQVPEDTTSDYEINSFCVNNIEYEDKQLSDLEIAEQILELEKKNKIGRKRRKK